LLHQAQIAASQEWRSSAESLFSPFGLAASTAGSRVPKEHTAPRRRFFL
jgi:hypothetical protein